jgi:hypothetical protein
MSRYYLLNKYFVSQKRNCILIFLMSVCGIVLGQGSNWTAPDPSQYNYNATMTAVIKLEGVNASNEHDELAIFSGSEIRGLSSTILIGNDLYFFVTIVSNSVSDTMTIKYYNHDMDRIFTYGQPLIFQANQIYGTIDNYLVYDFYLEGIPPLEFGPIPVFEGLENCPIPPIYLNDYITNRDDKSAIVWSVENNPDLILSLESDTLQIAGATGFTGNTVLSISVNDTSLGGLMYAFNIQVTILPSFAPLEWNGLPNQGIVRGDTFEIVALDSFIMVGQGDSLLYDYHPIITEAIPPVPQPNWFVTSKYPVTMTVTAKLQYTPKFQFDHPDDKLIAMSSSGQITGIAVRNETTGLFFLSVGSHIVGDSIQLIFYSGQKKEILYYRTKIFFDSGRIVGNIESPYVIDFAPIIPMINAENICQFDIVDTNFIGSEQFSFFVRDATYSNCLNDSTSVALCIVEDEMDLFTYYRDADGDGLGDPNEYITSCLVIPDGYVDNDDDCNDGQTIDPNISLVINENSSFADDDGIVCNGANVNIDASGGSNYQWSSGQITSNITAVINADSTFYVTVTFPSGCKGVASVDIIKVGKIVTSSSDSGLGSLRSVVGCAVDGDTITYDQPTVNISNLIAPIPVEHSIAIHGLSNVERPIIFIDFGQATHGFMISSGKTLTLKNIDITTLNHQTQALLTGSGHVIIEGIVEIR